MTPIDAARLCCNSLAYSKPVDVVLHVKIDAYVSIGLDQGEVFTTERFVRAIAENLCRLTIDSDGEVIDEVSVADVSEGVEHEDRRIRPRRRVVSVRS